MDNNLGTMRGRLEIDSSGVNKGFTQAQAAQAGFLGGLKRATPALTAVGKGMTLVGAAAIAGFAIAVKTSADFEKRISAVGAVSGATGKELDSIRQKALQLGKDTKFSATEAALAMEELAKAGVSTSDIMGGAADATVALAAAGEVELPRAAEIAANAMNVFNLEAEQMPMVADRIAGAANASAISVDEFAMSMQQSGAAAKLAGIGFEDMTTAIALMGNAGIKGSDAGTSLKTMLLNLNPTTEKQKNLMKELGLVTEDGANKFFDAAGNAKGLGQIAGELNTALKGMTKQQKLATLETLFGSDAIRAAAVLTDAGAKGFENLGDKIGKIKAADVAAKRMDNLAGSIELFKGSLETALIQTGAPFQAGIRTLVDGATSVLNAFLDLAPNTQKLVGQFLIFGGAASLVGGLLLLAAVKVIMFAEKIRQAIVVLKAFGIASKLAFLTNPVFLVIAAIVALGAALFILYKKNETFRRAVDAAWQAILSAFRAVVSFFQSTVLPALSTGWQAVVSAAQTAAAALANAWRALQPIIQPIITFLITTVRNGIAIITGIIKLFAALLTGNWTAAWNAIKQIAGAVLNQIGNVIRTIVSVILGFWRTWGAQMLSAVASWVGGVLAAIGRFAAALPGRILYAIGFIIGRWIKWHLDMIRFAVRVGQQVLSAIVSFFSKLPGRIAGFLASALTRMSSWAVNMVARARTAGSRALAAVVQYLSQLPGRVGSFVASALTRMGTFAARLPSLAAQAARGAVSAVASGLAALPGIVSGAVGRAISAFQGMIGQAFAAAKSLASSLWNGFKAGLFGSPKTRIEYAMIGMRKGFQHELEEFQKQHAELADIGATFIRDPLGHDAVILPGGGTGGAGVTQTNVFNISGVQDPEAVKAAVTSPLVLRTLSQAGRARGA
jgi:TP901 family phage tail tape measure protein